MIKFISAGESHGKCLTGIISGLPSGFKPDLGFVENELKLRRTSLGRSQRQNIEKDTFSITAGLSKGITTGAPLAFCIENKDFRPDDDLLYKDFVPRPGHADFTGAIKYDLPPMVAAERASARPTAAYVAAGAIIRCLLSELKVICVGHVVQIGGIECFPHGDPSLYNSVVDVCAARCADMSAAPLLEAEIERVGESGDSIGGKVEVDILGLPVGMGSYVLPSQRADALLAAALMSVPSVKAVEIGLGAGYADKLGSQVIDPILLRDGKIVRASNNCGGLEGGITNGNTISATVTVKPVPTIKLPVDSVDIRKKEAAVPVYKRSDVCAVPTVAVIARNVAAIAIAEIISEETGGSTLSQIKERFEKYERS